MRVTPPPAALLRLALVERIGMARGPVSKQQELSSVMAGHGTEPGSVAHEALAVPEQGVEFLEREGLPLLQGGGALDQARVANRACRQRVEHGFRTAPGGRTDEGEKAKTVWAMGGPAMGQDGF